MRIRVKDTLRSLLRLTAGEVGSRVASFILFAYISRRLGVEILGIVALAQTVAMYVTYGSEQGIRMIGARLVARDASWAPTVVKEVLKKRVLVSLVSVTAGCIYALFGPLPSPARPYVLCFVLAVLPCAFSLDWLAWGLNHLGWLGGWRATVSFVFVIGAVAGVHFTGKAFASITVANAASAVLGAITLWLVWRFSWSRSRYPAQSGRWKVPAEIASELNWTPVMVLGVASILNLMFKNFDTVMLGAMSSTTELGKYSAASKILLVVFGAYYLLTQTLYPQLSRLSSKNMRSVVTRALAVVALLGTFIGIVTAVLAPRILRIVYGSDLSATRLLRILAISVPFDFSAALLGTVLVSRGFDKLVLTTAGGSAAANLAMNWFLIPRLHAEGAAWATFGSYVLLLALFLLVLWRLPHLEDVRAHCGSESARRAVVNGT